MGQINLILRQVVCLPIKLYQYLVSPIMQQRCRFYPSCSRYSCEAIQLHGVCKGLFMAIKRLARCHQWSAGGYDPVIPNDENN
jgi:putative membrane protein insertion efficiency factor